ncbi:BTAD domain-containing putative transcriptional regulator [Lentzea sp. NBRC 102530]|uniref:BTAD domain-containing putative transcriptional regulator n=1 Tax=Lentzea sp. NBRC 102530 TaxID=3032201 RepID=UPI0024A4B257|nr:BTAD domain-containing putative transcriptional regulator [Lentzea sp. NBRC 102530]GLY54489.1 SARP family transcriptional regulator [Lentzea sp. NBRC 102530]
MSVRAVKRGLLSQVQVFGPVRAWRGSQEVALGSGQAQAIFAMLALRAGRVVQTDELVAGLWGDAAPVSGRGILHTHISALRRALEPQRDRNASTLLLSEGAGYLLRLNHDQVDAFRFGDAEDLVRSQLANESPAAALETVDAALALWKGEPLSGVPGPWAEHERGRLVEAHRSMVEHRAEALLAIGWWDQAVHELTAFVTANPFRDKPREMLLRALYEGGRIAEALEFFRSTRAFYISELGVEPDASLRELHERILSDDRDLAIPHAPSKAEDDDESLALFGRVEELAAVRAAVRDVAEGTGSAVWVEGEMGIGKSALLSAALSLSAARSCERAHAVADELGQRFPLNLAFDCFGIDAHTSNEHKLAIWRSVHDDALSVSLGGGLPIFGTIDKIIGLAENLCAKGPLVIVLDDVQWADEASLEVAHRLCSLTTHLPLLVICAARPLPARAEVTQLRLAVTSVGGTVLDLAPLTEQAVDTMIGDLVGARPGVELSRIVERAAGNPLFLREMADILLREEAVRIESGTAEVSSATFEHVPVSLVAAVSMRLDFLSSRTRDVLSWAALLGTEFSVTDLATVSERGVSALLPAIEEAFAGSVLREAGNRLAFRHPLIRQAIYERMPLGLRIGLHHQAAEMLARSGATSGFVAEQVLASGETSEWVVEWLSGAAPALTYQAPVVCIELLHRALDADDTSEVHRGVLAAQLSSALFRVGRDTEAEQRARLALDLLDDPHQAAEMRWILAYVPYRASRAAEAIMEIETALAEQTLPDPWRGRLLSLLSLVQRAGLGDLDKSVISAREGISEGERADDPFSIGQSLEVLWQVDAVRRDYGRAVGHLDRALAVIGTDVNLTDLRLVVLDNRLFTLQCLDRLDDASETLRLAFEIAAQRGAPDAGLHVAAAVHHFWLGDWSECAARLGKVIGGSTFTGFGLREGGPVLLMHGVGALIAVHQDDDAALNEHLEAGLNLPLVTAADRENCDFLMAARALAAVRSGDPHAGIAMLATILDTRYAQMMLRHQWLPDLVRLSLEVGDTRTALAAVEACEAEATMEPTPARASAAARRCRALVESDARELASVAEHYRQVGRRVELGYTLEDLAVVHQAMGNADECRASAQQAAVLYGELRAHWDLERMRTRLHGVTTA